MQGMPRQGPLPSAGRQTRRAIRPLSIHANTGRKPETTTSRTQRNIPGNLSLARGHRSNDVTPETSDEPCAFAGSGDASIAIYGQSARPRPEHPQMRGGSGITQTLAPHSPAIIPRKRALSTFANLKFRATNAHRVNFYRPVKSGSLLSGNQQASPALGSWPSSVDVACACRSVSAGCALRSVQCAHTWLDHPRRLFALCDRLEVVRQYASSRCY